MYDPSSIGDKTAHLLSYTFTEATEDRVCGIIKGYIEDNPKKIEELARPWLKQKKTTVSDYVKFIVEKGSKFNGLALMIFSIATKCHIGVINCDSSMWTTNASVDMEECKVLLVNRGKLIFESVEMIELKRRKMKKLKQLQRKKTRHIVLEMKKRIMSMEEMVKRKRKEMVKRKRRGVVKRKRRGMVKRKRNGVD